MKDKQIQKFRRQVRLARVRYAFDGEWTGTVRLDEPNGVRLSRKVSKSEQN